MNKLKIEYLPVSSLRPYERNTRKHTKKDIASIKLSIEQYGMNDAIGIWGKDNTIVEGHGRWAACKELGINEVPCVRLDHLNDKQRREYAIAHNATAEMSTWFDEMLEIELPDLDMEDFGFDIDDIEKNLFEKEDRHEEQAEKTQDRVENILNLGKGQFEGKNKYDFPQIAPVKELPEIKEWIGFNYVLSDKDPEGKAVHFFMDDYQFERIWNNPEKYVDKLSQYVCVAAPDFSPYGDMPLIAQMWNHYRKHWVAAYLQNAGVTVIPTIRCSTDRRSLSWFLDGEPHGGIVMYSAMWTKDEEQSEISKEEFQKMKKVLKPKKIFIYGEPGDIGISENDNVEYIESFSRGRFGK